MNSVVLTVALMLSVAVTARAQTCPITPERQELDFSAVATSCERHMALPQPQAWLHLLHAVSVVLFERVSHISLCRFRCKVHMQHLHMRPGRRVQASPGGRRRHLRPSKPFKLPTGEDSRHHPRLLRAVHCFHADGQHQCDCFG